MQYMVLIYGDERANEAVPREQMTEVINAYMAYTQALKDAKVWVGSNRLRPTSAATTVRIKDGQTKVLDGPFAETKEQLGGYYLIDVADLDAALSWAARCPAARYGTVEVRPDLGDVTDAASAHRAAERAARQSYGKLLAYLAARTGDVSAAEDALADAFAAALASWPARGVPQAPEAWLLATARRRMIDMARRRRVHDAAADRLQLSVEEAAAGMDPADIPDWRLRLMFACAHPALDAAVRGPLMLQTVLGLDAATIAAAFLMAPAAMGQRLVRAKRRIRDTGIPFSVPDRADLPARLDAVLDAIYAAFGAGWPDPDGLDPRWQGLVDEAIWLGRVVVALLPEEPEALGLLALMLYAGARRGARRSPDGEYVPLSEQDTSLWDAAAIEEAERSLQRAGNLGRIGRFQLEAAVQSAHAARRVSGRTDWRAILELYDGLLELTGSPVVAVNRAVAVSETSGPTAGLAALDELSRDPRLACYQPYWAARAELLARLGWRPMAETAYTQAIELEAEPAVRRFLERRREQVRREKVRLSEPTATWLRRIGRAPYPRQTTHQGGIMQARAVAESTEAPKKTALGALPEWDLSDLYPGPESSALTGDLATLTSDAEVFRQRYEGRLAGLSGAELGAGVEAYERLQEKIGRIMSYASLVHAGNLADPEIGRFYQTMQERTNAVSTTLLFFTLELNRLEDSDIKVKLADPLLARYRPWLRDTRAFRPHQLNDELEKLLHEKQVAGRAAWVRLFDQTIADLRFPIRGQELTEAEALDLLSDTDPETRHQAGMTIGEVLGKHVRTFALITNTLAKDKEIEDRWRRFPRPISSRNLANFVEDEVVDALIAAVRESYPRLAHRYYKLKARWFGADELPFWDRNAPLPEEEDPTISWSEAEDTVLSAYRAFSPEMGAIGGRFFGGRWIDAPVRPGKASGAFSHPTVPGVHPYLLLNYQGRVRDVMTLAHELGHGVHQVLANAQGYLMADTPLTLAETASVFGEMLTFRALLAREGDPSRRKTMLASKVEDMLNTVVRQIAFVTFEQRVHDERREAELTPDRLAEIWLDVQRESLGPGLRLDGVYRYYWSYIPHFIHTPFYVYAYAFGDCLVNSLYAVYEDAHQGFAERYLAMLRAGGTLRHRELLAPFGLDAADPSFWSKGLSVVAGFIDELEILG